METLRRIQRLACQLLLAWFALSLGAAVASPLLQPQSMDVVCSGSGTMQLMASDDGGAVDAGGHKHDCRLCVMIGAPPVPVVFAAHEAPADTPLLQLTVPVPSPAPVAFQPRGPPLL
jgi:hypothetical protein